MAREAAAGCCCCCPDDAAAPKVAVAVVKVGEAAGGKAGVQAAFVAHLLKDAPRAVEANRH